MIRPFKPGDTENLLDIWYAASLVATPFLSSEFLASERKNIRELYIPNTITWMYEGKRQEFGFHCDDGK